MVRCLRKRSPEIDMRNIQCAVVLSAVFGLAVLLQACGRGSPVSDAEHLRGTVQSVDGKALTVSTPSGAVRVALAEPTAVATLTRSDRDHIAEGSFLGITSVTGADGSDRAVEIHVFPESMRGSGEGSYPWDLPGAGSSASRMTNGTAAMSRMTNGTVAESRMTNGTAAALANGSTLTVRYKDGASSATRTITVPPDIPVVAIEPGRLDDLQPGVHVFVVARRTRDGALTADRVLAGKDGVMPPM
jgi:hypothetical protein